jgi:bacteriocin biosynthesis cyclodehydratase domain-containing protein
MTIILRLDPALPALWRSADALQLGVHAAAVLSPVEPWQLRLLHELAAGMPESALMVWAGILGVDPARVRELLARLAPALLRIDPDQSRPPARIVLHSARPTEDARLLAALRGVCVDAGIEVVELPARARAAASAAPAPDPTTFDAELAVTVAHHLVDPRISAGLLSADVAQLPVVVTTSGVRVGPLIVPGRTGCLHCAELHRAELDPAWPVLATQLLERTAPEPSALVAIEAATLVARFVHDATGPRGDARAWGRSVSVRAQDARREWRSHRPHPSCGCRSLEESGSPHEARARQSARTTARALRVPA